MVVLITGASSGIGRATAKEMLAQGWTVYASARQIESLVELQAAGCHTLSLDVVNTQACQAVVEQIEKSHGTVDVLINNAGYSQPGAIESVDDAQIERQFATNVFAVARLIRLVLPGMRRKGAGRIITIGSIAGRLTFPGGGIYHASKHALEAIHDALRFEVAGFGINVSLVQPGLIQSRFAQANNAGLPQGGPYAEFNAQVAQVLNDSYSKGFLSRLSATPEAVARTLVRLVKAKRPAPRRRVGASAGLFLSMRALLGDRLWDGFLGLFYRKPRAN